MKIADKYLLSDKLIKRWAYWFFNYLKKMVRRFSKKFSIFWRNCLGWKLLYLKEIYDLKLCTLSKKKYKDDYEDSCRFILKNIKFHFFFSFFREYFFFFIHSFLRNIFLLLLYTFRIFDFNFVLNRRRRQRIFFKNFFAPLADISDNACLIRWLLMAVIFPSWPLDDRNSGRSRLSPNTVLLLHGSKLNDGVSDNGSAISIVFIIWIIILATNKVEL